MEYHWWVVQILLLATLWVPVDASSLLIRQAERQLTLVITIFLNEKVRSVSGRKMFHSHSALQFEAFGDEPPLRVQLGATPESGLRQAGITGLLQSRKPLTLAAIEMGSNWQEGDRQIGNNLGRTYFDLGTVNFKNADIMDPKTGAGLMWDAWSSNIVYRSGNAGKGQRWTINDCNSMTQRLLDKMGVKLSKAAKRVLSDSKEYAMRDTAFIQQDVSLGFYQTLNADSKSGRTAFHLDGRQPAFDPYAAPELQGLYLEDAPPVTSGPEDLEIGHGNPNDPEAGSLLGLQTTKENDIITESGICMRSEPHFWLRSSCVPSVAAYESEIVLSASRSRGLLQSLRVVASTAAEVIGAAATLAAIVVVIIDFVNHDWIGGSFALAGLVAGIAVAAAVSGPVGWVLAGAVTAFFAILPGAFEKAVNPPRISDTLQIIRWATFGDAGHAGDEGCKEQHPGANCTVVFGAGVLSLVFNWDNFDSVAFLVQYNDGYAMTLQDMADTFKVVDFEDPNATAQDPAVIDCGTPRRMPSRWRLQQGNPVWCPQPKFSLRRNLVSLPVINQTADEVYNRVVPNPGGDCVIINEAASTETLYGYNITLVGGQAAIACNITAGLNDVGTVVPINSQGLPDTAQGTPTNSTLVLEKVASNLTSTAGNNITAPSTSPNLPQTGSIPANPQQPSPTPPSAFSPGSASTDGQAGHHIDPPPRSGFHTSYINSTNAACLSGSGGQICLPNGTYSVQDGTLGFNSAQATSLALPPGASLSFSTTTPGRNGRHPLQKQNHYTTNTSSGDFASAMKQLSTADNGSGTFTVQIPSDTAPALCLYTQPNYSGQVICGGPGGDDVPDSIKNKAQSLSLHGGVTAWIYGQYYGDLGGELVTTSVPNLGAQAYGPDRGGFEDRIVALWVVAS